MIHCLCNYRHSVCSLGRRLYVGGSIFLKVETIGFHCLRCVSQTSSHSAEARRKWWEMSRLPRLNCEQSHPFPLFIEPEGSLLCLQEPATDRYPEPDESNSYPPTLYAFDFYSGGTRFEFRLGYWVFWLSRWFYSSSCYLLGWCVYLGHEHFLAHSVFTFILPFDTARDTDNAVK
jgi:hypothetical protein